MKTSLILKKHIPYASLITQALNFCEVMLSKSNVLYPFAILSVDNDVHNIFVPANGQNASFNMIEDLQTQIDEKKLLSQNAYSILVYPATVTHTNMRESCALVLTIADSQGQNTIAIYPYEHVLSGIKIHKPYSCDFSD